jgi:hypothetical protein
VRSFTAASEALTRLATPQLAKFFGRTTHPREVCTHRRRPDGLYGPRRNLRAQAGQEIFTNSKGDRANLLPSQILAN